MSLAFTDLSPGSIVHQPALTAIQRRVVARSWRDVARDLSQLAARLHDVETAEITSTAPTTREALRETALAWQTVARQAHRIADHLYPDDDTPAPGILEVGVVDPRASRAERAIQSLVDDGILATAIATTLLEHDLTHVDPALTRGLRPAVADAVDATKHLWMRTEPLWSAATPGVQATVAASLPTTFHALVREAEQRTPPWVGMTRDLSRQGVRSGPTTRALIYQAMAELAVPALEARGFAALWAWRRTLRDL